ncbi:transglycosylase domain-containing protein, partial [Enterococcus sp. S181_ASV_20]|nr:transglycosylase domain-containing protein [Enterococcus sp. S181_ASV_20]
TSSAASDVYKRQINDTSLLEKAVLVGITNNPGIFDPTDNKKNALKRAKLILKEMNQQGYITKAQYDKAVTD